LPYRTTHAILLSISTARIYKKGQITIPKAIREATGFDIGDRVVVEARDDEIVLRHPRGVLEFTPPHPRTTDLSWAETRRRAREERLARQSTSDGA
jgi:AbrB family looped-hinge helix DNA binding protein